MADGFAARASLCLLLPMLWALPATPAAAQALNCANPVTQIEMTGCAARSFEGADAELNRVWREAVATARRWDRHIRAGDVPAEDVLRNAQRAWIPFRDQACEAEGLAARGGSLQNQIVLTCKTRLTIRRTEDLRSFGFGG